MRRVAKLLGEDSDIVYLTQEHPHAPLDAEMWLCLNSSDEGEKIYVPGPPPPEGLREGSFDEALIMFNILGYRSFVKGDKP